MNKEHDAIMSHGHGILKCGTCEKVMIQCRCMSKDKPTKYATCNACLKKKMKEEKDGQCD